jgi:hypothetical protein
MESLTELRNIGPQSFDADIKQALKLAAEDAGEEVVIKALTNSKEY